ncbi:MAG: DUF2807 domain-containing protein [Muribaculaceae bacterium]|nr:DUF2807 domain-containing protein [Muribaculaceae bacterium]
MKLKLLFSLPLISVLLTGCFAVTSGNVSINNGKDSEATIKKELKMPAFNEIKACQGIKVIVEQGAYKGTISVATTASAEKYLDVKVENGTLTARYENKGEGYKKIKGPSIITVVIPELKEADTSSGAYLELKGKFTSKSDIEFELSSGSALNIDNLSAPEVSIQTSSGSSAIVENLKCSLDAESSSGSSIIVNHLEGDAISLEASSGSSLTVSAVKANSIKADASSGGSINVSGKTEKFKNSASSGGSVNYSGLSY